ncbi:MAG: type IV pilin-like G/H family protein [Elainellaceae cyanobacterium]
MKSELKAKFLQHLADKRKEEGFTLIELLVVIIIIGILSAIALPSFLNQANKAKQSEARTYVGSMNRGQQAQYTEFTTFAASIGELGIGIQSETTNYSYQITSPGSETVTNEGESKKPPIRSYAGRVYLDQVGGASEFTTLAFICERVDPGPTGIGNITGDSCPTGSRAVGE